MSQLNDYNHSSESEKKQEDWMNAKWRPMMGWMYMFVCLFDFVMAPVAWTSIQAFFHGGITTQWQPLTLQGGGLFHVAMGAVIGISAYGRTKEKLEGVAGNNQPMGTQYVPPGGMQGGMGGMGGMNTGMGGGFGGQQGGMGGGFGAPAGGGFGGAPAGGGFGGAPAGGFGGASNGGFNNSSSGGAPAFGQPQSGSFGGSTAGGFGATTPSMGAPAAGGFGAPAGSTPALNANGQKIVPALTQPML